MTDKEIEDQRRKFRDKNLKHWQGVEGVLFPDGVPKKEIWESHGDIIFVLNLIGKNNLNHTFHPESGGLDLLGAGPSMEDGCIEIFLLDEDAPTIVKPKRLFFNSFPGVPEWSYFLLETGEIAPSGVYESLMEDTQSEELTRLPHGEYISRSYWDEGEYNGEELPEGTTIVERVFSGSFVTFQKSSPYNRLNLPNFNAYDAFQNKMTAEEFRDFCESGAKNIPSMIKD